MEEAQRSAAILVDSFLKVLRDALRDELQSLIQLTNEQQEDRLLNIEEACAMLAVSPDWLYRMRANCPLRES